MGRFVNLRSFPSLLAVIAACTALLGGCCGPPPCLTGSCPQVGHPVPDELYPLLRRELERSKAATPLVGARILEKIPSLFPTIGRNDEPSCDVDFVDMASEATFDGATVTFSRMLVARIRAVASVRSHVDVFDAKCRYLKRLAELGEAHLSDYQFSPGETGPAPPKSFVRYAALSALGRSQIPMREANELLGWLYASANDRGQWLLHNHALDSIDPFPQPSNPPADDPAPSLFRSWVPDMRRRLHGRADPLSLEIVLQRILPLGVFGAWYGTADEARKVMESVIAARGDLPITRGIPGAARDLAVAARTALFYLENPCPYPSLPENELPPPARKVYRPDEVWLADPAPARVAGEAVAARMRDLDRDLAELKFAEPRCHVLREQASWVPRGDADRLFDALVAPLSRGGKVALSSETLCRMRVATGLRAASESKRVGLVLQWLRAEPADIADYDSSRDDIQSGVAYDESKGHVPVLAAWLLFENLEWIERHADLRAWLLKHAQTPDPYARQPILPTTWEAVQPAYERLLSFHASGHPEANREDGRAILLSWIDAARDIMARGASFHPWLRRKLYALADFAGRYGLREQAQALFDDIARSPVPPRPAYDHSYRLSDADNATVASLLLTFSAGP